MNILRASLVVALITSVDVLAADYPPNPATPTEVGECSDLALKYLIVIKELQARHDAIGKGRGPQVNAGHCCAQNPGSTRQWCRTYQSHGAAWEAIHCAQNEKDRAVNACVAQVAQNRKGRPAPVRPNSIKDYFTAGRLADLPGFKMASDLLRYQNWFELATSWKGAGNDPTKLKNALSETSDVAIQEGFRNELVKQMVAYNLANIGVMHHQVEREFNTTVSMLENDFPRSLAPTKSQWALKAHSSLDAQRCQEDADNWIAACDEQNAERRDSYNECVKRNEESVERQRTAGGKEIRVMLCLKPRDCKLPERLRCKQQ